MSYLLDTNSCIRYLNDANSSVAQQVASTPASQILLCHIVRLVTHNTREFGRVRGLALVDWEQPMN